MPRASLRKAHQCSADHGIGADVSAIAGTVVVADVVAVEAADREPDGQPDRVAVVEPE